MKKIILLATCLILATTCIAEARTLTEQIARTREYIYQTDSANSTVTDAQVTEAINSGQELLSNLLSYSANHENVLWSTTVSTTTGETTFTPLGASTLAVGFKKVISVSLVYPGSAFTAMIPAIQVKPEDNPTRFYKATLKDPVFFIQNNALLVYPGNPGGTMYVVYTYLKKYTRLSTGSETVTVQDRYLDLLTLASAMNLLTWDNQTARAAALKASLTDQLTTENNMMTNSNVIEKVSGGVK